MKVPLFPTLIFTVLINGFTLIPYASATNAKGCVPLDSWTFQKVITPFKATIIKFDTYYPYGRKHEEYTKFSASARNVSDLLVAEVGIKDYGDMENMDLAEQFKVDRENYPTIKLFTYGKLINKHFNVDFTVENLKRFVRKYTDVYISLENCLEFYDDLAEKFIHSEDEESRSEILKLAENKLKEISNSTEKYSGELYLKIMNKIIEKGPIFVNSEKSRANQLLLEKVSNEKKKQIQTKLNILESFTHDEL